MKTLTIISVLLAAIVFCGLAQTPSCAQGSRATDRHLKAQDFRNTFGVNVHLGENNYRNGQSLADALHLIGISRVRTQCTSDGSTFVVVWNEPQIWDAKTNAAVTPPDDPVTINFGGEYAYQVYDPLIGLKPIATGHGASVTVNLLGSPLMIHLTLIKPMTP